jgi:hypothetical protein
LFNEGVNSISTCLILGSASDRESRGDDAVVDNDNEGNGHSNSNGNRQEDGNASSRSFSTEVLSRYYDCLSASIDQLSSSSTKMKSNGKNNENCDLSTTAVASNTIMILC